MRTDEKNLSNNGRDLIETDLTGIAANNIAEALNEVLIDAFSLYFKTKNFHWHVSGPYFRDFHLLFDEQSTQIINSTDEIAERVRKVDRGTLKSINQAAAATHVQPNEADHVDAFDMIRELMEDNKAYTLRLRMAHNVCGQYHDVASTSLIEVWIDESEKRVWFLREILRSAKISH